MAGFKNTTNPVLDEFGLWWRDFGMDMVLGAMKPVVAFAWAKGGADGLEGALRRLNTAEDRTEVDEAKAEQSEVRE